MTAENRVSPALWSDIEVLAAEFEKDSKKFGGYCKKILDGKLFCDQSTWRKITERCQNYLQLQTEFNNQREHYESLSTTTLAEFKKTKQHLVVSLNELFNKLMKPELSSDAGPILVSPAPEALEIDYARLLCDDWNSVISMIEEQGSTRIKNIESIYRNVYIGKLIDVLNKELETLDKKLVNRFIFVDYVNRRIAILREYFELIEEDNKSPRIIRFKPEQLDAGIHPIFVGSEVLERLADELDREKTESSIFPGRKASVLATSLRKVSLAFKNSIMLFMLDNLKTLEQKQKALKEQCILLEDQVASSQHTQTVVSQQLETLQAELKRSQGIIEALRKIHETLTHQKEQATHIFNAERIELSRTNSSLQMNLQRAHSILEEKEKELQQAQRQIHQLETDLEQANNRAMDYAERFTKISNRLILDIRQGAVEMRRKLNQLLQENWYIRTMIGRDNENLAQALETQYQLTESLCADVSAEKIDEHLEKVRALKEVLELLRQELIHCSHRVTETKEECSSLTDTKITAVILAIEEGFKKSVALEQQLQDLRLNVMEQNQARHQTLTEMGTLLDVLELQHTDIETQTQVVSDNVSVLGAQLQEIKETVKVIQRQADSLSDQVIICLSVIEAEVNKIVKRLREDVRTADAAKKANAIEDAFFGLQSKLQQGGSQGMDGIIQAAEKKRGFGSSFGFFTGKSTSLQMLEKALKNYKPLQDELRAKGVTAPSLEHIQVFSPIKPAPAA
jgi:chromosome segregation ATPase